jgi:hypothetical protein
MPIGYLEPDWIFYLGETGLVLLIIIMFVFSPFMQLILWALGRGDLLVLQILD